MDASRKLAESSEEMFGDGDDPMSGTEYPDLISEREGMEFGKTLTAYMQQHLK